MPKYFANFLVVYLLILIVMQVSCSELNQPAFTDDEIMEHATQKASSIVRDFYSNFSFFSFSTSVSNAFFESENILVIEIIASYEWHQKVWNRTAGGYDAFLHIWRGGFVDEQYKADKAHALKFDVVRDADSIEKTIRYKSVTPKFETPTAFRQ